MIVNLLVIKTGIIWPNGIRIKEYADVLTKASEEQSGAGLYSEVIDGIAGKSLSFQSP
jgi:hypothetical protein